MSTPDPYLDIYRETLDHLDPDALPESHLYILGSDGLWHKACDPNITLTDAEAKEAAGGGSKHSECLEHERSYDPEYWTRR